MGRPLTAIIPHALGKDEAHRRIEQGFATLQQQLTSGVMGMGSIQKRWEADRLHFEGAALGQNLTGRIDVLSDSVQIQIDLPELLSAIADRVMTGFTKGAQKLLEKKG